MANKEKPSRLKTIIGDKNADKMGNYQMATGGGTPIPKGEKLKNHPEAKRVMQPRDENGQFTYNAANFMTRKYNYHGKGDTIPPYLRGVNLSYFVKKDTEINYNNKIYLAGINMSAKEIINRLREYKEDEGFGKKLEEKVKGKPGRRSNITKKKMEEGKQGILDDKAEKIGNITKAQMLEKLQEKWGKVKGKKLNNNLINKKIKPGNVAQTPEADKNVNTNKNTQSENNNQDFTNKIKENPKEFVKANQKELKEVSVMLDNAPISKIVKLLASGKFSSIDDLKTKIKKK